MDDLHVWIYLQQLNGALSAFKEADQSEVDYTIHPP